MDGGVSVQLVTEEEEEDMMEEASTSPVQIIQGGGENHHHYHLHQKTTSPQCCSTCKNNSAGFLSSSLMKICSHCSTNHHSQEEKSGTWPTTKTEGGGGGGGGNGGGGEIIIEGEEDGVANGVISGGGATIVVLDDQGPGSLCSDAEVEELLLPPRAGILSSVEEEDAAAAAGTAELIRCKSTVVDQDEIHAKNSMCSQEEEEEQKNSMSHLCQLYKRGELGFGRGPLGAGSMMQQQQQSHNNNNKQLNSITMDHENHNASSFSVEVGQEKEQQLSSSIGQVSQLRNLHVDSGVSDPDSFKDETTSPLPCCPQSQGVESSCIQSVSRQLNFQQVEFKDHNKAGSPPSLVAISSGAALSCEDEDLWDEHEEDAGSTKVSSSLEENNNGSTHDYMCKICDKEFDGAKSLSLHKKTHPQYTLRRNPKRSRRFIDQDYAVEVSAAAAPAKKMSTMSEDKVKTCTECGKEFGSWKALFGHMRCHPEREWRGIQPPDTITHQHGRMNNNASHPPSRRKKPPPNVIVTADSDSESETESRRGSRKASDNESDTESIEAAYMNGDMQQSVRNWQKGKRTKRLRQSVRSLQAVTSYAPENSEAATTPTETRHQREIIDALMLLKAVESERKRSALTAPPQEPQVTDKEDVVLHHWSGGKAEEVEQEDHVSRSERNCHKEDKRSAVVKKEAEDAYPSEEDEDGANEFETGMQGVGPRMKYECTTCKRIFKSHQALGGHRASHKKVKGCYARTNVGEGGAQDQSPEEDITDDEAMNTENIELLPPYIQDASHTSEQEDHKPCHYLAVAKDDNEEMFSIARKSKGHECSICHRVFNSGQALGGHKRCHWGGTTASTSAPSEPYSGIRTNNQQQMSALPTTLAGHHQVSNPKREVLERELDLNMPAPESDDFVEQVGSSSAHILPPSLGHSNSYIPLLSSPFFSMAKKYASSSPFQDSVEKRHHLPNNSRDQYGFQAKDMPSSVDDNTPEQATASGGCKSETGSLGAGDQGLDNLQNFGQFGQSLKATCHNADVGPEPQVPLLLD